MRNKAPRDVLRARQPPRVYNKIFIYSKLALGTIRIHIYIYSKYILMSPGAFCVRWLALPWQLNLQYLRATIDIATRHLFSALASAHQAAEDSFFQHLF